MVKLKLEIQKKSFWDLDDFEMNLDWEMLVWLRRRLNSMHMHITLVLANFVLQEDCGLVWPKIQCLVCCMNDVCELM